MSAPAQGRLSLDRLDADGHAEARFDDLDVDALLASEPAP